ncbi:MAG: PTS sugar transporter subunit IIC [Clostridia bacterium]|nr:PTS sugar transporter subunit IIC [Clostridia bacterium]
MEQTTKTKLGLPTPEETRARVLAEPVKAKEMSGSSLQQEKEGLENTAQNPIAKKPNIVKRLAKRWFIDAFTGMALGLFATLIAGTILVQIGKLVGENEIGHFIQMIGKVAQALMGAGIGAGIAYMLKADKLTIFSCMVAGFIGAKGEKFNEILFTAIGNPVSAYVTALITCEICLLIAGKTGLDIVVIPLTAMAIAGVAIYFATPHVNWAIVQLAKGIATAMEWSPFVMGIIIAMAMGLLLTMPTSSAAIWVSIALSYPDSPMLLLAGGASVVGCAAHMVGFAVASFRENKFAGLLAQGLGTSMLQIPNIMKNPRILIPPVVASAVVGPLATTVFMLKCNASGGGMGTSGLVGVFGAIEASSDLSPLMLWLGIALLMFVIPALVSFLVSELLRKIKWIKPGDMKLELKASKK